jgi:hypothetical protein
MITTASAGRHRVSVALALLLLVVGMAVAAASADASQRTAHGRFQCAQGSHDWTEVAAGPNSFVTGNCRNGTTFDRVRHSDEINTAAGWEIGYIGGSYEGCGVVKANESTQTDASVVTSNCTKEPSQTKASFASNSDCTPGSNNGANCAWDPDNHGDLQTQLLKPCTAYANARPFSSRGTVPADPVGTLDASTQAVYPFRMRYITADRKMVLGFLGNAEPSRHSTSWSAAPKSMPQWVFLDISCVTLPHPNGGLGPDRPGV